MVGHAVAYVVPVVAGGCVVGWLVPGEVEGALVVQPATTSDTDTINSKSTIDFFTKISPSDIRGKY
jgi:hypothetical protein